MKPLHQHVFNCISCEFPVYPGDTWSPCFDNYGYNENHHWGNNSASNEGWGHPKNSRNPQRGEHRMEATWHPYHRDPRPPPAHRGAADRGRHSHRGRGGAGGAVHNARRYLEQRRLQGMQSALDGCITGGPITSRTSLWLTWNWGEFPWWVGCYCDYLYCVGREVVGPTLVRDVVA